MTHELAKKKKKNEEATAQQQEKKSEKKMNKNAWHRNKCRLWRIKGKKRRRRNLSMPCCVYASTSHHFCFIRS